LTLFEMILGVQRYKKMYQCANYLSANVSKAGSN